MGLKDLVKKAFLGATDEENKKNKARMREIFNGCVDNGDDYKLIYCHMENFTNAIIVDSELKEYGEAYVFNKRNESETKATLGYCIVSNPEVSFQFVPMTYQPGIVKGASYSVSITQSSEEVSEFKKFFKKGL